jgi:hypothetical protein
MSGDETALWVGGDDGGGVARAEEEGGGGPRDPDGAAGSPGPRRRRRVARIRQPPDADPRATWEKNMARTLGAREREDATFARNAVVAGLCALALFALALRGALRVAGPPRPPERPDRDAFFVAPRSAWAALSRLPPDCASPDDERARAWALSGVACSSGRCVNLSAMLGALSVAAGDGGEAYSVFGEGPRGGVPCASAHVAGGRVRAFLDPRVAEASGAAYVAEVLVDWAPGVPPFEVCAPARLAGDHLDPLSGSRERATLEGEDAVAWCLAQRFLGRPDCCSAGARK